jgi:hypothetical protein
MRNLLWTRFLSIAEDGITEPKWREIKTAVIRKHYIIEQKQKKIKYY